MELYRYDFDTKEYEQTERFPMTPEDALVFQTPYSTTRIPIPPLGQYEAAFFNGAGWDVVIDYRNVPYWLSHREKFFIEKLGESPPDGAFLEQPPLTPAEIAEDTRIANMVAVGDIFRNDADGIKLLVNIVEELVALEIVFTDESMATYTSLKAKLDELYG